MNACLTHPTPLPRRDASAARTASADAAVVRLARGDARTLARRGAAVTCTVGIVWITQEGSPADTLAAMRAVRAGF